MFHYLDNLSSDERSPQLENFIRKFINIIEDGHKNHKFIAAESLIILDLWYSESKEESQKGPNSSNHATKQIKIKHF